MRIVVATDGSDNARLASQWLTTFPLPATAELLVVAAADLPWALLAVAPVPAYDEAVVDAARRAAQDARAGLARRWPAVEVRVLDGDPRLVVTEQAEEWRADLVVVGARGLGAIGGFLLGSVSTAIVHAAHCPVLVVKGRPRLLERAVIAVDGSEDALAAARFFANLPLEARTIVTLVGVVEAVRVPPSAPGLMTPMLQDAIGRVLGERRARVETGLQQVEREFAGRVATVERRAPIGVPADEIITAARSGAVDLVVVGARGLGAIKRLFLGSVSERVLHHVECPVLVVKGRAR